MTRLVTPDELIHTAKTAMLEGREPEGVEDWSLVMNFLALNIEASCALPACQVLNLIYDMGLTEGEVIHIVLLQQAQLAGIDLSELTE